jgi:hypothetical protein
MTFNEFEGEIKTIDSAYVDAIKSLKNKGHYGEDEICKALFNITIKIRESAYGGISSSWAKPEVEDIFNLWVLWQDFQNMINGYGKTDVSDLIKKWAKDKNDLEMV